MYRFALVQWKKNPVRIVVFMSWPTLFAFSLLFFFSFFNMVHLKIYLGLFFDVSNIFGYCCDLNGKLPSKLKVWICKNAALILFVYIHELNEILIYQVNLMLQRNTVSFNQNEVYEKVLTRSLGTLDRTRTSSVRPRQCLNHAGADCVFCDFV